MDFNKKSLTAINRPTTPHNTSQYLTFNYSQGRKDKVQNLPNEYTDTYYENNDMNDEMLTDYMNEADDYCIPGGSMRGNFLFLN